MKRWIYKFIFLIAVVPLSLFMLPEKQVKAQEEQTLPEVLMKVPYYSAGWTNEYTMTYEFTIRYRLDNNIFPFTDNLNNNYDWFLVTRLAWGMQRITGTLLTNLTAAYKLEEIQIEDNYTVFVVRLIIGKTLVYNEYGGPEYMNDFFTKDSAFYIKYDVYNLGYNDGYYNGLNDGRSLGYQDGYLQGHEEGYQFGYEQGHYFGYGDGYDDGYIVGHEDGKNEGYIDGYEDGKEDGKEEGKAIGYDEGYNVGLQRGQAIGYSEGYTVGYDEGLKETTDKNFSRLLRGAFSAIGAFLGINLLPGISIGTIIAVPIIFGVIAFILGRRRGD